MSPLLKKRAKADDKYNLMLYCFLSGGIALAIMYFTLLCHDNTLAFGENTVLRMDLYHQYGPLYAEMYDRITNGYSLIYSWTSGLGGTFIGNLFNYCCSPFAFVMLLLGHENMPEAIAIIMTLNAVFSAVSFTYYINKTTERVNKLSIAFGLLYAFSGYFVAYSWNIMWLDAMSVFPLVILGIEKIVQRNKPGLYIFAMSFTMITNYYMAYMVCILSVLYFLYFYFSRYEAGAKMFSEKVPALVSVDPTVEAAAAEFAEDDAFGDLSEVGFGEEMRAAAEEGSAIPTADASDRSDVCDTAYEDSDTKESYLEEFSGDISLGDGEDSISENTKEVRSKKIFERSVRKRDTLSNSRFWITGCSFALSSVLCFLISAFALIPVWYCLQTSSATGGSLPSTLKVYFNLFDFITNHLPSLTTTIRSSGDVVLPNVYCGLLSVMFLPLYFLSNKISGRRKVAAVVFLGVFYASFATNYTNYIWHGMHMPNDLPFRYSFGYSFLLLIIAYNVMLNIEEVGNKILIGSGMAVIAFCTIVDDAGSLNVTRKTILLSVIFAVVYVIFLGMYKSPKFDKRAVASLLIIAVVTEICLADISNYIMAQPKENYVSDYDDYCNISELTERDDESLFYRTELSKLRARMDPCWYGYNGVSTFSSMAYEHVAKLMNSMGMFGNDINSYTYYPQTPIFNSMFAMKYIYDNTDIVKESDLYTKVAQNDVFVSYRYNYDLPLAFAVKNDITEWDLSSDDPFEVQNSLIENATGVINVLVPVDITDADGSNISGDISVESLNDFSYATVYRTDDQSGVEVNVYAKAEQPGQYFVYAGCSNEASITVSAEDYSFNYSSSDQFILDVGPQSVGAEIHVKYSITDSASPTVKLKIARLDSDGFEEAYNNIKSYGLLSLEEFDETFLKGTVNVNGTDKLLYTSIPYDKSWVVTVDGKKISYGEDGIVKIGDALMGVNIPEGEHTVTFKYVPRGLKTGITLSLLGMWIVVFLALWKFVFSDICKKKGIKLKLAVTPESYIK